MYDFFEKKFYYDLNYINVTKNVTSFHFELLYKCDNDSDLKCSLRETDKNISNFGDNFAFHFYHPVFTLNHSNPNPFHKKHFLIWSYIFDFKNPTHYALSWNIIKYKDQKGLFDIFNSWTGKKNEYLDGYIQEYMPTPVLSPYRHSSSDKYKVMGSIRIYNLYLSYEEYKRKNIKFMSVLANICALFSSIKGIIEKIFAYYSKNYDNHKMISSIMSTKIKNNSENKKTHFELLPLSKDNDNDSDNDNLQKNLIINESDDDNKSENFNLKKISCLQYLLNNIYCKKLGFNIQDRINICNEIIEKYMSYENILYHQIMLEQLLLDYKWNDDSLKNMLNNCLITKLKNLEIEIT
jgi:hypothetical protein